MSATDHAVRYSTVAVVAAVAGVAGWVSYEHALDVIRAHGETGTISQVYPVTVDGLIYSASMVLLDAARRKADAPVLARWLLGLGIAATLAANVAAGLHYGPLGAVVAAWPAVALVGSYELLMLLIRSGATAEPATAADTPVDASGPVSVRAQLNGHAAKAERLYAAEVTAGSMPGIRRIQTQMHIGQPKARLVQEHLRTLTIDGALCPAGSSGGSND
jgi:hypothetical protein